jgi:hypothetical protein
VIVDLDKGTFCPPLSPIPVDAWPGKVCWVGGKAARGVVSCDAIRENHL